MIKPVIYIIAVFSCLYSHGQKTMKEYANLSGKYIGAAVHNYLIRSIQLDTNNTYVKNRAAPQERP